MTSRSNPDWLAELLTEDGDNQPIDAHDREELVDALLAATSPRPINVERHQQIILGALAARQSPIEDQTGPLVAPTDDERAAAAVTRAQLESNPLVQLLRAAHSPLELAPHVESNVRKAALAHAGANIQPQIRAARWMVWCMAAAAAVVTLWWYSSSRQLINGHRLDHDAQVTLVRSRTTEPLFVQTFNTSTTSERIDKIAMVREKELRENRFALWGLP